MPNVRPADDDKPYGERALRFDPDPAKVRDQRWPCVLDKNDGPIKCRCTKHFKANGTDPLPKCTTGFGDKNFEGKFLLDGKKLADDTTDLATEKLDLYDMQEYEGMD